MSYRILSCLSVTFNISAVIRQFGLNCRYAWSDFISRPFSPRAVWDMEVYLSQLSCCCLAVVLLLSCWQTLKTIVLFFSLLISKKERRSIDYLAKAFDPAVWLKRERSRIRLDAKKAEALEFQGIPTKLKERVASEMLAISGRWIFSALWWNVGSFIELSSSANCWFK